MAEDPLPPESKEVRVLKAKIKTRQDQIDSIGHWGPGLLVVIGFFVCLTVIGIVLGIIMIGIGIWWSAVRENEKKRLQNEIKEFEAEL